jgi:hypothetical protein
MQSEKVTPLTLVEGERVFEHTDEIMAANNDAGRVWFHPSHTRHYDTQVYGSVHYGRYFIVGEKVDNQPRRYRVQYCSDMGHVSKPEGQRESGFNTYTAASTWLDHQVSTGALVAYAPGIIDARGAGKVGRR